MSDPRAAGREHSDSRVVMLAELVQRSIDGWDDALEVALFGTGHAEEVAAVIERFCSEHLADPVEALLYRPGVGAVAGLRLRDGRRVLVKVHRWNVSVERLSAVQAVQHHLGGLGLPAPRPLVSPTPLGTGIATAEEFLPGDRANGRDPTVRGLIAASLHDLIVGARALVGSLDVGAPLMIRRPGEPLWPVPHDLRFDFAATAAGAEWIDELATIARKRLSGDRAPAVIGHFDWRVENLAFVGSNVAAIYDWDSLAAASEAIVVGNTAGQFCTDWGAGEEDPIPTLDDMAAFVDDYERVRGAPFTAQERETLDAANLALVAYGARCQHSDLNRHPEVGGDAENRWLRLLRERGERSLANT